MVSTQRTRTRTRTRTVVALALAGTLAVITAAVAVVILRDKTSESPPLKTPIVGLLDRHRAPPAERQDAVNAYVVDVPWAELQPRAGQEIVRDNAIDKAVSLARRDGLQLKLRVRAGIDAPDWAKVIGGAPVPIYHTENNRGDPGAVAGTIGRFWLPEFSAAYADLQTRLAAIYDGVPQIRQTDVSQCSTIYSETYLRGTSNPDNVTSLVGAGFTRAADERCHIDQISAHRVWRQTLSDVAFNPYTAIEADGSTRTDLAYTLDQMSRCRSLLGARCVLQNNSISSTVIASKNYRAMYEKMRSLGGPIDFQTAMPSRIGDHNEVLGWAAEICASSVELPSSYPTWSPPCRSRCVSWRGA